MTRARNIGLFAYREDRKGLTGAHAVTMGPYIYTPASAYSAPSANGTLSKEGLPVVLQVTEPLVRNLLDTLVRMENDLLQRWGSLEGRRPCPRAE